MATTNPTISPDWTKIVTAGDEFTLTISTPNYHFIEVAVSDTDVAPTVDGHQLQSPSESFNRTLSGPGYVYAKSCSGVSTKVILTAWTPP